MFGYPAGKMGEAMREPGSAATGTGVVLIVPEALGETTDLAGVRATLAGPPRPTRVLLCLTGNAGHELAATLAELRLDFQILLSAAAARPAIKAPCLRAPSGMSGDDQNEFALALCDVALVASKSAEHPLVRTAVKLGKAVVVGDPLPVLAAKTLAHGLDPESHGWRIRRRMNGRVEQAILESLAFAWSGWTWAACADSLKRLRRCAAPGWRPGPYFAPDRAPDDWRLLCPDRTAIEASAPIVAGFEAMDRSALHGSYIHRDITWLTHFGAAFAVFAAVAGFVFPSYAILWGVLEIATLATIAASVYQARTSSLQDRWTACRFAAEQLRIARMSLPLFVLPPALATAPPAERGKSEDQLEFRALDEVKRVVRDQGLPHLALSPKAAAAWVHLIVFDQLRYHHGNHHKLERAEARLRGLTQLIFAIAVAAVLAHLIELSPWVHRHDDWLLLITAAGPALGAALHGAGTRLGIVHRAALSEEVEKELRSIDAALVEFLKAPTDTPEAWTEVRRLAYAAANAMGRENTSWHGLVRRYRDELP
jgi:hypothetical protein